MRRSRRSCRCGAISGREAIVLQRWNEEHSIVVYISFVTIRISFKHFEINH
jgi:hypothetical protein